MAGLLCFGESPAAPSGANAREDGYRGIWFTLGQFSKHGDKYSGGLGTYTANHTPLAVYSPRARKTFFTYGGTRKGERHLLIMASYFDHRTGRVPQPVVVHDKEGVNDPHDNGSINLDEQGYYGFGPLLPWGKVRCRGCRGVCASPPLWTRDSVTSQYLQAFYHFGPVTCHVTDP